MTAPESRRWESTGASRSPRGSRWWWGPDPSTSERSRWQVTDIGLTIVISSPRKRPKTFFILTRSTTRWPSSAHPANRTAAPGSPSPSCLTGRRHNKVPSEHFSSDATTPLQTQLRSTTRSPTLWSRWQNYRSEPLHIFTSRFFYRVSWRVTTPQYSPTAKLGQGSLSPCRKTQTTSVGLMYFYYILKSVPANGIQTTDLLRTAIPEIGRSRYHYLLLLQLILTMVQTERVHSSKNVLP